MLKLHHYHNATVETIKTNRFPHHKNQDNRHIILCHCCKIHSHNQQCRFECRNEHLSIQNRKCTAHSCHKNHENCIWLNNLLICCNKKQQHDVHTIRSGIYYSLHQRELIPVCSPKLSPVGWRLITGWVTITGKIPILFPLQSEAGGTFINYASYLYMQVRCAPEDNTLILRVLQFSPLRPQDTLCLAGPIK